jgi:hypothetical protein
MASDAILDDGGPAFPIPARTEDDGVMQITHQGAPGMSLRDWFAGMAMSGICGDGIPGPHHHKATTAFDAWEVAEAMMAERHRRYGKQPEPEAEVEGAAF